MNNRLPFLPGLVLKLFLYSGLEEGYLGDLAEDYHRKKTSAGPVRAYLWICWITLASIPGGTYNNILWSLIMFRNYMHITIRNIKKYKGYTVINIAGLTVGMTCFILIMLYVRYELSFDKFHENSKNTYRVALHLPAWTWRGSNEFSMTTAKLGPTLMQEYPEVKYATRLRWESGALGYAEQTFTEEGIFADRYFLNVFSYNLTEGNPETALNEPFSIILTKDLAEKYFGNENPMGKVLKFRYRYDFVVTGIVDEVPDNSFLKFDYIMSFATYSITQADNMENWSNINYETHVVLQDGTDPQEFNAKLPAFVEKYHSYSSQDRTRVYYLQPLESIHLHSNLNFEAAENSSIKYVYMFTSIAVLILLIACINYVNSATARAAKRSREIGVRKTIGARKSQLISQFLGESFMIALAALFLSVASSLILLQPFNAFVKREIEFNLAGDPGILLGLAAMFVIVGLVSGLYPALYMSSFRPVTALKSNAVVRKGGRTPKLRNSLVVLQFGITVILVVFSIAIQKQLYYIKFNDAGFDRDNVVVVQSLHRDYRSNHAVIKEELKSIPDVTGVSFSNYTPLHIGNVSQGFIQDKEGEEFIRLEQVNCAYVDYDFIDINGLEMLDGRNFSPEFSRDSLNAVIINETTARIAGVENPVGKRFRRHDFGDVDGRIIGVVKDFHFTSYKTNIEPVILRFNPQRGNKFLVRISPENINNTIDRIRGVFHNYNAGTAFDYYFMDDAFNSMYEAEQRLGTILVTFTIIAIFIASLGLVSLVSYIAEQSTKEIGIRKTLGATVPNILALLSRDFIKLVAVSNLIALPVSYYLVDSWLREFTYKTSLGLTVFIFAAIITVIFALATVIMQAAKAARANPVDSLRYE